MQVLPVSVKCPFESLFLHNKNEKSCENAFGEIIK